MKRYQVREGDQVEHLCCYSAVVVDTTKPTMIGDKQYVGRDGQLYFDRVCECFDREDAQIICDALNKE